MDVELTLKNYRCFSDEKPARIILRKGFTCFLGPNNAGKSALLKFLFEFRRPLEHLSLNPGTLDRETKAGRGLHFAFPSHVLDLEEVFCNRNERDLEFQLKLLCSEPVQKQTSSFQESITFPLVRMRTRFDPNSQSGERLVEAELGLPVTQNSLNHFDPILKALSQTLYIGPFRNAINAESKQDYFDIKVGRSFIQAWKAFKLGKLKKTNEHALRVTEDIERIFGFRRLEISPAEDDTTLQVFVDGKSFKLEELGSGISQMILILGNAAMRQPSYILIDEPELNLHPSLQLDFLTTIASYATEGILFATHSYGLARSAADWIYTVRQDADGMTEVREFESTPNLSEMLGELSFSGYRDLGYDTILLVEGKTDVRTVQQFLRLYRKEHQIVLLPLGGSSLIQESSEHELHEIKRLSPNVSALIDSEKSSQDAPLSFERQKFVELCQKAGIARHVLQRRAIENYFPEEAVKKVKGDKYHALAPFEALKSVEPAWAKQENWRIARMMTKEDLDGTDLGEFLSTL